MSEERRSRDRYPSFRMVELMVKGEGGEGTGFQIMIRDAADDGLGGVYIGQDPLDAHDEFTLKEADGTEKDVRIVWTKKVAESVVMLGLELIET